MVNATIKLLTIDTEEFSSSDTCNSSRELNSEFWCPPLCVVLACYFRGPAGVLLLHPNPLVTSLCSFDFQVSEQPVGSCCHKTPAPHLHRADFRGLATMLVALAEQKSTEVVRRQHNLVKLESDCLTFSSRQGLSFITIDTRLSATE